MSNYIKKSLNVNRNFKTLACEIYCLKDGNTNYGCGENIFKVYVRQEKIHKEFTKLNTEQIIQLENGQRQNPHFSKENS
jgi:hypothetical protein